ncbi:MAG: 3-dehydroquinate synthase [Novosphingobium sp.]|nr:3-dehydroquinate synthase [Novosphingobium sp.]
MAVIPVTTAGGAYEVRVARGLLGRAAEECAPLLRKREAVIVTDANVARHWRAPVEASFAAAGMASHWFELPPGEASKSWAQLGALLEWLLAREVERGDAILALGGGMVGDLTGLAAALLKRGCRFIQLPTTLLAQVDSSVGGKTAVNFGVGKNLVGAFHQPALVLADLSALDTLPPRELRAGYAEVVKYGVLGDAEFFAWCEASGAALLAGDAAPREHAVAHSVAAKARIVAADERETSGRRALLNLGHTFGHALEAATGFSDRLLHGEAVALGMVLAARFSARRGLMATAGAERIAAHVAASGLPSELSTLGLACDGRTLAAHMLHDKKMDAGALPFVLLRGIGEAFLDRSVEPSEVAGFLDDEIGRGMAGRSEPS